jgi:putative DNA primase/helicase
VSETDLPIEELVRKRVEAERLAKVEKSKAKAPASPPLPGLTGGNGKISRQFVRDCLNANQLGDGLLYAELHQGKFILNMKTREWLKWAEHYWTLDEMDESLASVETVAQRYLEEAKNIVDDIDQAMKKDDPETATVLKKTQQNIYKRVRRLRDENGRINCRKFAAVNPHNPLAISGNELDQDPWLFACPNGVIDLRTGDIRPGRCEDWISKASPIEYPGIDARPTVWEPTLLQIFDGDQELVDYMQRLLGYGMTGLTSEAVLPIMWGHYRNGKTTIVEKIKRILGPLSTPVQAEMLLDQGRNRSAAAASPDIMALKGVRIAFGSESDEGRRFSTAKVKWLSGSDTLVARNPYDRRDTSFTPTHFLILLTNNRPHAPANDLAFWIRVHLIPFPLSFIENPVRDNERLVDKSIPDQLKKEEPEILAWLVRGCLRWQRDGLAPPKVIIDATKAYQREEDVLADFLDQKCHRNPKYEVPATDIYDAFKEWHSENVSKKYTISQKKFGSLMKDKFDKVKRGTYFYKGVRLLMV